MTDWNKIIWSDESKFNFLFGSDGRVLYVRRRMGEENAYSKLLNLVVVQ